MKVNVAGAGAGKTTKMADLITGIDIQEGKIVFCIAFTNAAVDNIKKKVSIKQGTIPDNIRISTIHSFLYNELIRPYYYFLYGKQFDCLSTIDLPINNQYKQQKLTELETNNILHYTKIPEKAKWVAYQKSGDRNEIKMKRKKILNHFADYCAAIFVDEAQDIGEEAKYVLKALDKVGVEIYLYGDPKQDVKGLGQFRAIIDEIAEVNYIPDCHRCPQMHLDLSNLLASVSERQIADANNAEGSIAIVFETDIKDIQSFINSGSFELQYISMKRENFATHDKQKKGERFETLRHEVHRAISDKWNGRKLDIEINRLAFYVTERMLEAFDAGGNASSIISKHVSRGVFDRLTGKRYAQMIQAFTTSDNWVSEVPLVHSIESIKGLEAKRCLFILTTDLAPYLFREKTDDNKTSHLLYVALTRSLDHLSILVTKEVEDKYSRTYIKRFFKIDTD